MNSDSMKMKLLLGDIVSVISPTNDELHNRQFYIDYVDTHEIHLIEEDASRPVQILTIDDNMFTDKSIRAIHLLYRNPEVGYVRQNGLLMNVWINIYFGGSLPVVITGQIKNIEEDMIELQMYPSGEYLYVDFEYKGLISELQIERIEIRESPKDKLSVIPEETVPETVPETASDTKQDHDADVSGNDTEELVQDDDFVSTGLEQGDTSIVYDEFHQDSLFQEDQEDGLQEIEDLEFGDVLGSIVQYVNLDEKSRRFGLDIQMNDLLHNEISKVAYDARTSELLKDIHVMLERYQLLREDFSTFDRTHALIGRRLYEDSYSPLANKLTENIQSFSWIKPVVRLRRKLYDVTQNEDVEEADDYLPLSVVTSFSEFQDLETEYKNDIQDQRYANYIRGVHNFFVPFSEPLEREFLEQQRVVQSLDALVENYGVFQSSVNSDGKINNSKYVLQQYVPRDSRALYPIRRGETRLTSELVDVAPADTIDIHSFVVFPIQYAYYTHRTRNASSLYRKLEQPSVFHYDLRKRLLNEKNLHFDLVDQDYTGLLGDRVTHVERDVNLHNFKEYVNAFSPSALKLFDFYKTYLEGSRDKSTLSLESVICDLEALGINKDDLQEDTYRAIQTYLYELQHTNRSATSTKQKSVQYALRLYERNIFPRMGKFMVFLQSIMQNEAYESMIQSYFPGDTSNIISSQGEFLTRIMKQDSGRLLFVVLQLEMILLANEGLENMFKDDENNTKLGADKSIENEKDGTNQGMCQKRTLVKRYYSTEGLEADNGIEIYMDTKLDDTPYIILENYEKEQNTMKPEEFIVFLTKKLIKVNGLLPEKAARTAKILQVGKRVVEEGNIALLQTIASDDSVTIEYYQRKGGRWVYDETATNENKTEFKLALDESSRCEPELKCFGESCEPQTAHHERISRAIQLEMQREYFVHYYKNKEDLEKIKELLGQRLERFRSNNTIHDLKYNTRQRQIANQYDPKETQQSPHTNTMLKIMALLDVDERSEALLSFKQQYTRGAVGDENIFFYYCVDSDLPLMPTFLHRIAYTHVTRGDIPGLLRELCNTQGEDGGDAWIDVHSRFKIANIDFDSQDGFTNEGRLDKFHEVLDDGETPADEDEKEHEELVTHIFETLLGTTTSVSDILDASSNPVSALGQLSSPSSSSSSSSLSETQPVESQDNELQTENSVYHRIAIQIVDTLMDYLKIEMPLVKQSVVQKSLQIFEKYKTNKNLEYTLVLVTLSVFLVMIQVLHPQLKMRKTVPSCNVSLMGFPVHKLDDNTSVTFIACVAKKIQKRIHSSLNEKTITQVSTALKSVLEKFVIPEMKSLILKKRASLHKRSASKNDSVVYFQFQPPVGPFKIRTVNPIEKAISKDPTEAANALNSKIMNYAYSVIQSLNNVVAAEDPVLKNVYDEPFMENACCQTKTRSTLVYFLEKDKGLVNNLDVATNYSKKIHELEQELRAVQIFLDRNTKHQYPPLLDEPEQSINDIFIAKFGKAYNELIGAQQITVDYSNNKNSTVEVFRERVANEMYIGNENDSVGYKFDETIRRDIYSLIDMYETNAGESSKTDVMQAQKKELFQLREKLFNKNESMKTKLFEFLKVKTANKTNNPTNNPPNNPSNKATKNGGHIILDFIDTIERNEFAKHEDFVRHIEFMKMIIRNMAYVFPYIVIHKKHFDETNVPKHWGLSDSHKIKVQGFIAKYYKYLESHIGDTYLTNVFLKSHQTRTLFTEVFEYIPHSLETDNSVFSRKLSCALYSHVILTHFDLCIHLSNTGNLKEKAKMREYIQSCSFTFHTSTTNTQFSRESIMKNILKIKELEKDSLTKSLKALSERPDELEVTNHMKHHKLGKWGLGLEKGFTRYDKNMYDEIKSRENAYLQDEENQIADISYIEDEEELEREGY